MRRVRYKIKDKTSGFLVSFIVSKSGKTQGNQIKDQLKSLKTINCNSFIENLYNCIVDKEPLEVLNCLKENANAYLITEPI